MEFMNKQKSSRVISKIYDYIKSLDLNLHGYNVLTEVGSDLYNYMPIIPLLAGAEKVMAWTQDSSFGKASHIFENCNDILNKLDFNGNIEFFDGEMNIDHLICADMITNSGFLRPLDEKKLKYTKSSVVIPLMYESWELRNNDVDLDYCRKKNIIVAGTNESHEDLQVFQQIGHLAVKMALEAGYEVNGNTIVVWSDDNFGEEISNTFSKLNPKRIVKTTDFSLLKEIINKVDFIFLCDYNETRSYTNNSFFNIDELSLINNDFGIVHLYGDIDLNYFNGKNIPIYPRKKGISKTMSFTLSYLGINPFVGLMAGGFKVGEYLLKENYTNDMIQICH